MVYRNCASILRAALLCLGLGFLVSPAAQAQTSTGSIRGTVSSAEGGPIANADVVARNPLNGKIRTTTTNVRGFYSLPGLPPATYELSVRLIGHKPEARQIPLGIGQTLTLDFTLQTSAVEIEELTVVAQNVTEMRTSEIATNVTQEQIKDLPSSSRNFLDLTVLAPGTTITNDRLDGTARSFSAGAQSADQVNVFIDGASYKNDLIRGGVVGQDRSRGNPFPRNAVQEFRVLTQNYKAEYQKSSSAIITAVTKSGGNEWSGSAFAGYQNQGLVALDTFARANQKLNPTTFREPDYKRWLVGLSGGGPIIRNKLHFFGSYEGNYQDRSNLVNIVPPTGFPALDSIDFASRNGFAGSPFRSSLFFGKLSYAAGKNSALELSANTRNEKDTREFGGNRPFESGVRFNNSVVNVGLKHSFFTGPWLNEAMVNYQRASDNPRPVPTGVTVNRFYGGAFCCAQIGPDITIQDFTQKRLALRNDLTYSGLRWNGSHVLKGGVTLDFLNYRVLKQNGVVPRFVYEEVGHDPTLPDSFKYPDRVEFRAGNPNFLTDNTQFGVYLQDDWSLNDRLTINAGIRWDYESHMLNYDYQTPQGIVDSLTKYSSLLQIPIDPKRYFTDGTQRPRFTGAIQPRLGFSYALDKNAKTTIFGGFGIFYDRTLFDQAIEERFAQQNPNYVIRFRQPGDTTPGRIDWNDNYLAGRPALDSLRRSNPAAGVPEVKLIPNDLRPPKSTQYSLGARRRVGDFTVEAAYTGVRSFNVFTFYFANMNFTCPERSFGVPGCFVQNNIPGYSTILVATNNGKTWYNALQVKVDRPYRRSGTSRWNWGAGLAYTFAKRETQGFNDDFSFPNPADYPRQVRNDERHRVVINGLVDVPYLFGIQAGALVTIASGQRLDVGDRFSNELDPNSPKFVPGGFKSPTFKNVDLRFRKDLPGFRGTTLSITADIFNVFNTQNLGGYETFNPADTANFGKARGVISDPRRLQLGMEYNF